MKRTLNQKTRVGLALLSATGTLALGFGWADLRIWQDFLFTIERFLVG